MKKNMQFKRNTLFEFLSNVSLKALHSQRLTAPQETMASSMVIDAQNAEINGVTWDFDSIQIWFESDTAFIADGMHRLSMVMVLIKALIDVLGSNSKHIKLVDDLRSMLYYPDGTFKHDGGRLNDAQYAYVFHGGPRTNAGTLCDHYDAYLNKFGYNDENYLVTIGNGIIGTSTSIGATVHLNESSALKAFARKNESSSATSPIDNLRNAMARTYDKRSPQSSQIAINQYNELLITEFDTNPDRFEKIMGAALTILAGREVIIPGRDFVKQWESVVNHDDMDLASINSFWDDMQGFLALASRCGLGNKPAHIDGASKLNQILDKFNGINFTSNGNLSNDFNIVIMYLAWGFEDGTWVEDHVVSAIEYLKDFMLIATIAGDGASDFRSVAKWIMGGFYNPKVSSRKLMTFLPKLFKDNGKIYTKKTLHHHVIAQLKTTKGNKVKVPNWLRGIQGIGSAKHEVSEIIGADDTTLVHVGALLFEGNPITINTMNRGAATLTEFIYKTSSFMTEEELDEDEDEIDVNCCI